MATITFANLDKFFTILDETNVAFGSVQSSGATLYQYNTTGGDQIDFGGTGLTSGGAQNLPTGGTVTSIKLDINDDSPASPEISITGSWTATSLGVGAGTAAQQRDNFWSAALSGSDTLDFTLANYANTTIFGGDGAHVSNGATYNGSDDQFSSGAKSLGGGSIITGDYFDIISGSANGGADNIFVGALQVYGDFFDIHAGMTADGGADQIKPAFLSDNLPSIFVTAGDANTVYGTLNGGDDFIDLRGTNFTGYTNPRTRLIGDAQTVAAGGVLNGGNDSIWGSVRGDDIFGDERNSSGTVIGGNDTLRGNAGDDYIYGGGGDDSIDGGDGVDTVDGGAGNDSIEGGDAWFDADSLFGGDGDDTISGGLGADSIDGGLGSDWASFAESTGQGATVNLATGATGGWAVGDVLTSIENLIGTTGADNFVGDANANIFIGGNGTDTLNGGDGNDTLIGGTGADQLIGGADIDTAYYAGEASAVTVYLFNGFTAGAAAGDTFNSIENITGTNFNDQLAGDGAANLLDGGGGNDYFFGGDGNDTILGGDGNDTLQGQGGADFLDGGAGTDTISYAGATIGTFIYLFNGFASGAAWGDTFASIENLTGTGFNDQLAGDAGANLLDGGGGNDYFFGGNGNDTILGGDGNDTLQGQGDADVLNGGNGIDTVSYAGATIATTAYLYNGFVGGSAWGDTFIAVENLTGSSFNDQLAGDAGANVLDGGLGNDLFFGGNGNDTILGGDGNDTLLGQGGNDFLNGGAGIDTASYAGATIGTVVYLFNGFASGAAWGDTFSSIENLIGTSFNDQLAGDGGANLLDGGIGNDHIFAGGGNDTLIGGAGVDTLEGQGGNDVFRFTGGFGADRILDFVAGAAGGDVIELIGLGTAFDSFSEVIAASSQQGADTLINFGGGNTITLVNVTMGNLNAGDFTFA